MTSVTGLSSYKLCSSRDSMRKRCIQSTVRYSIYVQLEYVRSHFKTTQIGLSLILHVCLNLFSTVLWSSVFLASFFLKFRYLYGTVVLSSLVVNSDCKKKCLNIQLLSASRYTTDFQILHFFSTWLMQNPVEHGWHSNKNCTSVRQSILGSL